jgi:hypothetical protein
MTVGAAVLGFLVLMVIVAVVLSALALVSAGGSRGPRGRRGATGPPGGGNTGPPETLSYYLQISDFIASFVAIPTSNVIAPPTGTTIDSSYLAGRAPLYNADNYLLVGTCSASFLNMQTSQGIFSDIANYIATADGLIVTWFTPSTLINLELDNVLNGMVTECIVTVTTKVGASRYFRQTYFLTVSSDGTYIHFQFVTTPPI